MEHYQYKIGRLHFSQKELTWEKNLRIVDFIATANEGAQGENITMDTLKDLLIKHDLMGSFLSIVLDPKKDWRWMVFRLYDFFAWLLRRRAGPFNYVPPAKAANTELSRVFTDFFFLNADLIDTLKKSGTIFALIAEQAETIPGPKPTIGQ